MKLLIFDMDGTLFQTDTVDIVAMNQALQLNGFEAKSHEEITRLFGYTLDYICTQYFGMMADMIDKFTADLVRFEIQEIAAHGELYDGVIEGLGRLRTKGYTLCICSNGCKDYIQEIVTKFDLQRFFKEVWYSRSGYSKSQAVGALKEMYPAAQLIVIGDRASDIEAAKANGGISIAVTYGFGKDEVKAADFIAHNFAEVEEMIDKILG